MKTQMEGLYKEYNQMLNKLIDSKIDFCLERISYTLDDAGYHGWSGQPLKDEYTIYTKVLNAYTYLYKALKEATGSSFAPESETLEKLDTDELLHFKFKD